jgi:hypothetical protein
MRFKALSLLVIGLGVSALANAAKAPLYDDFSGDGIDRGKWNETEAARYVDEKGRLFLARYLLGGTSSDTGVTPESWSLNQVNPAAPRVWQADITLNDLYVGDICAANPTPSRTAARIVAAYFNIRPGGPLPNDRTGDVLAQIRAQRYSNSVDAPGVLQVSGVVSACTSPDCNSSVVIGAVQPLGTVSVGSKLTATISWDKAGNTFSFQRDLGAPLTVSYTDADNVAPSLPFTNLSIRNEAANCLSGPRVKVGSAALFDNVRLKP